MDLYYMGYSVIHIVAVPVTVQHALNWSLTKELKHLKEHKIKVSA